MDVKQYFEKYENQPNVISNLAESIGTNTTYLGQISTGFRKAGHQLALSMHRKTNGEIHVADVRPDIYPDFLFGCIHCQNISIKEAQ